MSELVRARGSLVDLTVVIPVRDGIATIDDQLRAVSRQTIPAQWELVVADNGSTDGTGEFVRQHSIADAVATRVVDVSAVPGVNAARNGGTAAARGRWIAFCDADDV